MNFEWKLNTIERRQSVMYANTHSHTLTIRNLLQMFLHSNHRGPRCINKKRVILSQNKYFNPMKKNEAETVRLLKSHQPFTQHHQSTLNYKSNTNNSNNNRGISSKSFFFLVYFQIGEFLSGWKKKWSHRSHTMRQKTHDPLFIMYDPRKKEVCH